MIEIKNWKKREKKKENAQEQQTEIDSLYSVTMLVYRRRRASRSHSRRVRISPSRTGP